MRVNLDPSEFYQAVNVGAMRRMNAIKMGGHDPLKGDQMSAWDRHIEGACAEMAVAKALGVYWSGKIGQTGPVDMMFADRPIEVRYTPIQNGSLLIHEVDADDSVFVLVTGRAPAFTIRGAIAGRDGKQAEFWKDPQGGRPAYFVPQSRLFAIELLHLVTTA